MSNPQQGNDLGHEGKTEKSQLESSSTRDAPVPDSDYIAGVRSVRVRDGQALHDGGIYDPHGCPRGLGHQCAPLSRIASLGFESFMCCGQTRSAPVPTDRLRLCIKSTHDTGVDLIVNLDERDTVHTASVLMGGLASLGSVKITACDFLTTPEHPERASAIAVDRSWSTPEVVVDSALTPP